jgi:YggT family protein
MGIAPGAVKRGPGCRRALAAAAMPGYRRDDGSARRPFMYGNPFVWLIETLVTIYIWLLIAQAVLSWLLAFGVVNRYNRAVSLIGDFLYRVTEPALRPIRNILPSFGGIDISPIILILLLMFLERFLLYYVAGYL